MFVGYALLNIIIEEALSLKEKRMYVNSIKDRVKHKFNIAIAEVENKSIKQSAIGISCVSNKSAHCDSIINNVITFIDENYPGRLGSVYKNVVGIRSEL